MRWARRLLLIATFVGVLVLGWRFAAENSTPVTVGYLLGEWVGVALWLVVLLAFGVGVAVAGLLAVYQLARLALVTRRYRKTAHEFEAEVHQLRNLPLASDEPAPGGSFAALTAQAPPGDVLERGA